MLSINQNDKLPATKTTVQEFQAFVLTSDYLSEKPRLGFESQKPQNRIGADPLRDITTPRKNYDVKVGCTSGVVYVTGNPVNFIDPLGLFPGRGDAQSHMINTGHTYMTRSNAKITPGSKAERMRNAEHYLAAYTATSENKLMAIPFALATPLYGAKKYLYNFAENLGLANSPYTYTPPTTGEYAAGFEGVIDGLFKTNDVFLNCK